MDIRLLDLTDRVEVLESLVFQLNGICRNMGMKNCRSYEYNGVFDISNTSTIQIGTLNSFVEDTEVLIVFNMDSSQELAVVLKQDSQAIGGGKIFANSVGMLQILSGKCIKNGGIVLDFGGSAVNGVLNNLKVFLRGKATFNFVAS